MDTKHNLDYWITVLDTGFESGVRLADLVQEMTADGLSQAERKRVVLESDYATTPEVAATMELFG